jgi:uncharacterized membrane protein YpjA
MNFRTGDNNTTRKKTTTAVVLSAASLAFLAAILVASSVASAGNAQAASKGTAKNKYLDYINHVRGSYRFLEKHTWHYNSTK